MKGILHEGLKIVESILCLVNRKIGEIFHVVRQPDRLQWGRWFIRRVIADYLLDVVELGPSVWRGMPAKSPEWRKAWSTNKLLVLLDDLLGWTSEEEVDVDVTTSRDVTQDPFLLILVVWNDWWLSICVSEEQSHKFIRFVGFNKDKRMHASKLFTSIAIIKFSLILRRPHWPSTFTKCKATFSLAETVYAVWWHGHIDLSVLVLHHKCLVERINKLLIICGTFKREREWFVLELEADHIQSVLIWNISLFNNILRNLKSCGISSIL